eukprot:TRINITY_DN2672_c0_g1_i1.p1 TRINITY_DN2672_c0_g1~~TRINITY_DN2672_c0_g1_i1.p1  ORF type:complete len:749 (+),score=87.35 TRINITY_DN2672_c0_g1_i1:84-2330(+)
MGWPSMLSPPTLADRIFFVSLVFSGKISRGCCGAEGEGGNACASFLGDTAGSVAQACTPLDACSASSTHLREPAFLGAGVTKLSAAPAEAVPAWVDCRDSVFGVVWNPLYSALLKYVTSRVQRRDLTQAATRGSRRDIGIEADDVQELDSIMLQAIWDELGDMSEYNRRLSSAMETFKSVLRGEVAPATLAAEGLAYGCVHGMLVLTFVTGLWTLEHTTSIGNISPGMYFTAATLLLKTGLFDFLGSTRWGFLRRVDIDAWITDALDGKPVDAMRHVSLAALKLRAETLKNAARVGVTSKWPSRASGAREAPIAVCIYYDHHGTYLNAFSALHEILPRLHVFGCAECTLYDDEKKTVCNNPLRQLEFDELCTVVGACSEQERDAMGFNSFCEVIHEVVRTRNRKGEPTDWGKLLGLAVASSLPSCDVIVDPMGIQSPLLSAIYPSASMLVWQSMAVFHNRGSQMNQGELLAVTHRAFASNPRHAFMATTEKLVAQMAWQSGVIPILCPPPMLHMAGFKKRFDFAAAPDASAAGRHLVLGAGAMIFVRPFLEQFVGSVTPLSFLKYRWDPPRPLQELSSFRSVVFIPWNPHAFLFMELYALGMPLLVPDADLMYSLQRSHFFDDQIHEDYGVFFSSLRLVPVDASTGRPPVGKRRVLVAPDVPDFFWPNAALPPSAMAERFFTVWNLSPMKTYAAVVTWNSLPELALLLTTDDDAFAENRRAMADFQATLVGSAQDTLKSVLRTMLSWT